MAAIDSTSAGAMIPLSDNPPDPEEIIRLYVAEVTGISKQLVRKRWYPKPLERPALDVNWCAVGLLGHETEGTPLSIHSDQDIVSANGTTTLTASQKLDFVCSFYGANARFYADRLRLGLGVGQSNEYLKSQGLTLLYVNAEVVRIPELFGAVWCDRFDVNFRIGRAVTETFGIRSIRGVGVEFIYDR